MPGLTFAFLPADIISQILNFGLPSPIDVQVIGKAKDQNRALAQQILRQMKQIPGIVDARIQQEEDYPELHVNVDRTRAQQLGLTQNDVARNLLLSLSGSFQTAPTFWLDRTTGVSYNVVTQAPQYRLTGIEDLRNIPVSMAATGTTRQTPPQQTPQQILGGLRHGRPRVRPDRGVAL